MIEEQTENRRWYIIHAYSGQEDRVKKNLEQRILTMDVKDKIFQVIVPTEEEMEYKDGQKKINLKKIFPGYILVQMEMDDDSWFVVRNTPGVTGFVSAEDESDNRPKPVPLEQEEVDRILKQIRSDEPRIKMGFARYRVELKSLAGTLNQNQHHRNQNQKPFISRIVLLRWEL